MIDSVYARVLEEQGVVIVNPKGISMLPLIKEATDSVVLKKPDRPLKKLDVVAYRRPNGTSVLHRIIKVKDGRYDINGDNLASIERNVPHDWIFGIMVGVYQGDRYIDVNDKEYIKYSKKVARNLKWRRLKYIIERIFKKKKRL